MGNRRMVSKQIVDTDVFLDLPISARLLYYDLIVRADDDGFIDSPRKIMKIIGATNDDMNNLIAKNLVITFESGVVVITDWRIHNYIQSDRYHPTIYTEEKALISLNKDTNKYEKTAENQCIQNVYEVATEVKLSKDKLSKENIKKVSKKEDEPTFNDVINSLVVDQELNTELKEWVKSRLLKKDKLTNHAVELACKKVLKMPKEKQVLSVQESIIRGWSGIFEIKDSNLKDKAREAYIKDVEYKTKQKETAQQRDDRNLKRLETIGDQMLKEWNNDNTRNNEIGEANQNALTDNSNTRT